MKKYYAIIAVFLAARLLTGCAGHTGMQVAAPAAEELHPLGTGLDAGNAQGRTALLPTDEGDGSSILYWVDYASAQCVPLCAEPGCAHDSEACTAWLPDGAATAFSLPAGGVLKQQFVWDEASRSSTCTLIRCNADGSDPHTLAAFPGGSIDLLAADGEGVWFDRLDPGSETMSICRVPLAGGEVQVLYSYAVAESPLFLGCDTRRLVYMRTDQSIYDRMAEASANGASEEELAALRQQAAGEEFAREAFFIDADTGAETSFLQWNAHEVQALWRDGTLWRSTVEDGEGVLRWDRPDGTGGEARYAYPDRALSGPAWEAAGGMVPAVEGTVAGQVLLRARFMAEESLNDPAVEAGLDDPVFEWERIALDPATGSVTPLTLRYVALGDGSYPIELLGRSGDDLFVKFEEQRPFDPGTDPHGSKAYYTQVRCGLITRDDFWASRPNYREVEMPANIAMW